MCVCVCCVELSCSAFVFHSLLFHFSSYFLLLYHPSHSLHLLHPKYHTSLSSILLNIVADALCETGPADSITLESSDTSLTQDPSLLLDVNSRLVVPHINLQSHVLFCKRYARIIIYCVILFWNYFFCYFLLWLYVSHAHFLSHFHFDLHLQLRLLKNFPSTYHHIIYPLFYRSLQCNETSSR